MPKLGPSGSVGGWSLHLRVGGPPIPIHGHVTVAVALARFGRRSRIAVADDGPGKRSPVAVADDGPLPRFPPHPGPPPRSGGEGVGGRSRSAARGSRLADRGPRVRQGKPGSIGEEVPQCLFESRENM
jgi:hypothetical protein